MSKASMTQKISCILLSFLLILIATAISYGAPKGEGVGIAKEGKGGEKSETSEGPGRNRIIRKGIKVEFSVEPFPAKEGETAILEGEYATIKFKIRDEATNTPVSALKPAAWIDLLKESEKEKSIETFTCKDKVRSYLKGPLVFVPILT